MSVVSTMCSWICLGETCSVLVCVIILDTLECYLLCYAGTVCRSSGDDLLALMLALLLSGSL